MHLIEERTKFQKIMLMILAAMAVVFAVITGVQQTREGILLRQDFLLRQEVTDADCWSGRVDGKDVTLLRWYDGGAEDTTRITVRYDGGADEYTVYLGEPMIPLSGTLTHTVTSAVKVPTVRITKNGETTFEGGWQRSSGMFFTSDGEWTAIGQVTTYPYGALPDDVPLSRNFLMELTGEPETVTRGSWAFYFLMVFLSAVLAADVAFPYALFRWRYHWWVKDPEPTEDYMTTQHVGWVIGTAVLLGGYIFAATTLM